MSSRIKSCCRYTGLLVTAIGATALGGCAGLVQHRVAPGEVPMLVGTPVRDNRTPMDGALACFGAQLRGDRSPPVVVAVGEVRDLTGKYSVNEGTAVTQGGALMVASALGKLGGAVILAERFDPSIGERELAYTDRRQLGDGRTHAVGGHAAAVPWLPYYGGSITASDYYIVGGITELNYNIRSGGAEFRIGQLGPKARTYTQSVAVDLRIVDTRTLLVARTISLTKQFSGYEVGFNSFRFFGSELFDINIGAKAQEPLQLGIRAALEEASLRLVAAVTRSDPAHCLSRSAAPAALAQRFSHAVARAPSRISGQPLAGTETRRDRRITLVFYEDADTLSSGSVQQLALELLEPISRSLDLILLAPETENANLRIAGPLTDRRIAATLKRLADFGVRPERVRLVSRSPLSLAIGVSGFRQLAHLRILPIDPQTRRSA